MPVFPKLLHTAIDTTDCRGLAEFYRELLGARYRPGDEPPADGAADDADWLVLVDDGATLLLDRTADEGEPLYVLADPSGHPFCIFVA